METKHVQAGKDTILAFVDRASAVDAVAELIWNGLDAEATRIDVTIGLTDLGAPDEIVVSDNGCGMTYDQATLQFTIHGESWKKTARFSPKLKRPMHGKLGRGRFLAYVLADQVRWTTVSKLEDGKTTKTAISGSRILLNSYDFDGPVDTDELCGTTVVLHATQEAKVARLTDEDFLLPLAARLAPSLLALTGVKVTYRDQDVDPRSDVVQETELDVDVDAGYSKGHPAPKLVLVEWARDLRSKTMMLCDEHGAVVTEHNPEKMPPAPVQWTAYLKWSGFADQALMNIADLHHPEVQHAVLLAAADKALADFLTKRMDEQRGKLIHDWKAQGVYPYKGDAATPTEEVERELFDVVALVASPAIGKDTKQKRLSLQLLKEAVQSEPIRMRKILSAVLDLSEDEQEILAELLERMKLGSIVRAARTIADRIDFVRGLRRLLYSDETKKVFREIDQLHPILVTEPWVFGDEWVLTLSESGLTGVVAACLSELGKDVEYAPLPVKLPSGKSGRVDMVFYRHLPETERSRHLVVELKRPMKLTMTEYGQVANYATTITQHASVAPENHFWDFWLVGTEMDQAVADQCNDVWHPGLAKVADRYRLWIVTWAQLLDRADERLEAFRKELDIYATDATEREYLQRKHAEYIPPEPADAT